MEIIIVTGNRKTIFDVPSEFNVGKFLNMVDKYINGDGLPGSDSDSLSVPDTIATSEEDNTPPKDEEDDYVFKYIKRDESIEEEVDEDIEKEVAIEEPKEDLAKTGWAQDENGEWYELDGPTPPATPAKDKAAKEKNAKKKNVKGKKRSNRSDLSSTDGDSSFIEPGSSEDFLKHAREERFGLPHEVKYSRPHPDLRSKWKDGRIFVSSIVKGVTKVDLESLFDRYGRLEYIHLRPANKHRSGTAVIKFEDHRDAKDALDEDGRKVRGHRIKVEEARPLEPMCIDSPVPIKTGGRHRLDCTLDFLIKLNIPPEVQTRMDIHDWVSVHGDIAYPY